MPRDAAGLDPPPRRGRATRGARQSRTARRTAAQKIVLRTAWLDAQLVYWFGMAPEPAPEMVGYRPVVDLIAARLAGLAPGVYALRPHYEWQAQEGRAQAFAPRFPEAVPVTLARITDTVRAWTQATEYPRALPPLVGDIDAWRAAVEARFQRASAALRAVDGLAGNQPDALGLEAFCLWIGPDTERPSRRLSTAAVAEGLRAPPVPLAGQAESIRRLAAVILGQRRAGAAVPRELAAWADCGRAFPTWPADGLHMTAERCAGGPGGLMQAAGAIAPPTAAPLAAIEALLAAPESDPAPLLAGLGAPIGAVDDAAREPRRRAEALAGAIDRAYRRLPAEVLETWPTGGLRHWKRWRQALGAALGWVDADLRWAEGQAPVVELSPRASSAITRLTEWVTGFQIQRQDAERWLREFIRTPTPSLGAHWAEHVLAETSSAAQGPAAWQHGLCGLVGRWAAFGEAAGIARGLAAWVAVCRTDLRPGRDVSGILCLVMDSFGDALRHTRCTAPDTERLLGLIDQHARELVPDILPHLTRGGGHGDRKVIPTPEELGPYLRRRMALLGRLAALGVTSCGPAFRLARGRTLVMTVGIYPDAVPSYLDRLMSPRAVQSPGTAEARIWCEGWSWLRVWRLADRDLADDLWEWSRDLVFQGGLEPHLAGDLLDLVLDFCLGREGYIPWSEERAPEPGNRGDQDARQALLAQHFGWLEQVREDARLARMLAQNLAIGSEFIWATRNCLACLSMAYQWACAGQGDAGALGRAIRDDLGTRMKQESRRVAVARAGGDVLSAQVPTLGDEPADWELAMALACGNPRKVPALLRVLTARSDASPRQFPEKPIDGWRYLGRFAGVQARLGRLADRAELMPRLLDLLERIALTTRLPARRDYPEALALWAAPPPPGDLAPPRGCPPELAGDLARLAAYRAMAGHAEPFGTEIQRLLDRRSSVARELEALESRAQSSGLPAPAATRLAKLHGYRDLPGTLDAVVIGTLARRVPKLADLAELAALERIVADVLRAHWQSILGCEPSKQGAGDRDWDNALRLYFHIRVNRSLLRRLLRDVAQGHRRPDLLDYGSNRDFARRLAAAGVDVAAWLAPFERTFAVDGDRWTIYAATDPLEVLQMGNLFGTCLSVDDFNAFSTVANAVEINKRVLYVKNGKGHVIGRKLIAMSRAGLVFGFYAYGGGRAGEDGADGSPWLRILLDQCCLVLAERSSARLGQPEDRDREDGNELSIFADWYDDGTESFDPWIFDPGKALDEALDPAGGWMERLEHEDALCRFVVFLGDAALSVLQRVPPEAGARSRALAWVARHTQSAAVRALLEDWGVGVDGPGRAMAVGGAGARSRYSRSSWGNIGQAPAR